MEHHPVAAIFHAKVCKELCTPNFPPPTPSKVSSPVQGIIGFYGNPTCTALSLIMYNAFPAVQKCGLGFSTFNFITIAVAKAITRTKLLSTKACKTCTPIYALCVVVFDSLGVVEHKNKISPRPLKKLHRNFY